MGIVQRASIQLTVVSYAGAALGYINKVLLFTNFLSPAQVGLAALMANLAVVYAQFSTLGMMGTSLRFFPFFEEKEKQHHGFLFWGSCIVMVGFMIVSLFFLFCKSWVVKHYGSTSPLLVDYYYYLIPMSLATVYFNFFDSYLRALLKTVVSTILSEFVGRIFITICISLYALKLIDFRQFVMLYVLSTCLLTVILVIYTIYLKQFFMRPVKSKRFKRLFKVIMVYAIYSILGALGGSIIYNVDSLMIAAKLSLGLAGIYTTAFFVSTIMVFPYRSIQKISQPLLARFWKERNMKDIAILYQKSTLINMVLGGILFLGLWVNIDSIFSFMPKEYYVAKYAFFWLAVGRYFDLATGLNALITLTSKKYRYDLGFNFLLVVLTVLLNLVLIPMLGITGAAIATMISLTVYNIIRLIFVQYFFKMQPFTINCLWIFLITMVVWGIVCLIPTISNKYIDMIVKSAAITILYGSAILFFRLAPDINDMIYNVTGLKLLAPKNKG